MIGIVHPEEAIFGSIHLPIEKMYTKSDSVKPEALNELMINLADIFEEDFS